MKKIAASILGKGNKSQLIDKLIDNGIEYIHYDVMDGNFVENISLPSNEVIELFSSTKSHYKDVHLMVNDPEKYILDLKDSADQISIHVESLSASNLELIINKYYKEVKIGLAINPSTQVESVFKYLDKLNHVMIMSVTPGKGGQEFIESSLEKVFAIKNEAMMVNPGLIIEIDGGINGITGPKAFKSGVHLAVSGSYLINNLDNGSISKILK